MKKILFFSTILFTVGTCIFLSCNKENNSNPEELHYFTDTQISNLKTWMNNQKDPDKLDLNSYPDIKCSFPSFETDTMFITAYTHKTMYLNEEIIGGANKNYTELINEVRNNKDMKKEEKDVVLSFIQLSRDVLVSKEAISLYKRANKTIQTRADVCGCDKIYATYQTRQAQCKAYGYRFGPQYCNEANYYWELYWACKAKKPTCPNGFVFDGANCYSRLHFPAGYSGFVWKNNNGFYTKRNCAISRSNNCCPRGYLFDGANCHFFGLYFPQGWEPFIWNNAFYLKPKCL